MSTENMMVPFIAGAFAGMTVDIGLFPIDTIKTRLQSRHGFTKSGGFRGVYNGIGSAVLGSIPSAAAFFFTYETSKKMLSGTLSTVATHSASGCLAETVACAVRVPFEVVKQTSQANPGFSTHKALVHVLSRGGVSGLFRGYVSMVFRDIPFSIIQMPMWEYFKNCVRRTTDSQITGLQSGVCGCLAGGITAAITTPLDVAKTRIILNEEKFSKRTGNPVTIMLRIAKEEGSMKLFSGVSPRVIWLSTGGFIFFGSYEFCKSFILNNY